MFLTIAIGTMFILESSSAGAVQCEDGWLSPSDGGPGTCSWHGGVKDTENQRGSTESLLDRFQGFGATEIWFGILLLSILGSFSASDGIAGVSVLVACFSAFQVFMEFFERL